MILVDSSAWYALAASILDNASNGVNGTLTSVTSQVSFLGFDGAVTASLINAVPLSDGLCGPPQSQYPPPPPPSSGLHVLSVKERSGSPQGPDKLSLERSGPRRPLTSGNLRFVRTRVDDLSTRRFSPLPFPSIVERLNPGLTDNA
jgi:hypothetical protein